VLIVTGVRTIEKLLRQQAALAHFGSFAFSEPDLQKVLNEAAHLCAESVGVPCPFEFQSAKPTLLPLYCSFEIARNR